jgi:glycosyltransferase involved in cell wall biosynthesis
MSPPVVSVIVPTYANRARRLQSAIASIWAQEGLGDKFDMEVIVVDDASTGPTEEVVRRFPGTRYVRLETRSRVSAARNAGIAEADGDYVAFLDDDDLWLPHRLSGQVTALEQARGVEVAYSQRRLCGGNGASDVYPSSDAPSGWVFETAVRAGAIAHISTLLVPREAIDKVGGFAANLPRGQETEFSTRLALYFPFRFVPGTVSIYLPSMTELSSEQFHSALVTKRDNLLALIERQPNEGKLRKLVLSATSWQVAQRFHRSGELGRARREFLQWIAMSRPLEGDAWTRSKMQELIILLALASESPIDDVKSLCAEVKRAAGPRGLKQRLELRALFADLWTSVALHHASGRDRNARRAGSAAVRAILQNPLKPLSRPGVLRLAARVIPPLGRGPAAEPIPSRNPQAAPSGSHSEDAIDAE